MNRSTGKSDVVSNKRTKHKKRSKIKVAITILLCIAVVYLVVAIIASFDNNLFICNCTQRLGS